MSENVDIGPNGETVQVGDKFVVVREEYSLLPRSASEGEVLRIENVERGLPGGPEVIVSVGGQERPMSPTSLGEALGVASYLDSDWEPCLEER